jgi:thioester reductase-like protein
LRFAVSARTKPVHFVSTVDVVGPQARMGSAREPLLCEEPPLLAEPYTLTKWVADQWVAQASSRGIPVCIYRTGYIGPHSKTGDANASGWFETYLRTVMKLRSIPADFPTVGVTPVDSIAEAIFDLSRRPDSPHHAFRLIDDERRVTRETIVGLAASLGCRCEVIPSESWRERLVEYCAAHPSDPAALLGPYLDTVGDRVHERGPEPTSPAAPAAFSTDELPKTESGLARFLSAATRGEVPRRTAAGTRTPDRMAPNDA